MTMEKCLERCKASGFQMEEEGSKPRGQTVEVGKGKEMDFFLRLVIIFFQGVSII